MNISEENLKFLRESHSYLNLVELHGAANIGNMFQALARLETVIQKIQEDEELRKKEEIKKEEEKE